MNRYAKKSIIAAWLVILTVSPYYYYDTNTNAPAQQTVTVESKLGNVKITNFSKAKRILKESKLYTNDFYCGCALDEIDTCLDKSITNTRASKVEWEHLIPASRFGKTFTTWDKSEGCSSARECAGKDSEFSRMEADLYNLKPVNGYVNLIRSDSKYGDRLFGKNKILSSKCKFKADGKVAVPHDSIRGDIARVYLYFAASYSNHFRLDKNEVEQYVRWSNIDPVDENELKISDKIFELQGNLNPYVYCSKLDNDLAFTGCVEDVLTHKKDN